MLKSLSPIHRVHLIAVATLLAASVGSYLFTWSPVAEAEAARQVASEAAAKQGREAVALRRAVTAEEAVVGDLEAQLAAAEVRLEPVHTINQRVATLTRLATRSGVSLESVQLGQAATPPPGSLDVVHHVPIRVSGRSTYRQCVELMVSLGEFCPDVAVRAFALRAPPSAQPVEARFELDLVWHAAGNP